MWKSKIVPLQQIQLQNAMGHKNDFWDMCSTPHFSFYPDIGAKNSKFRITEIQQFYLCGYTSNGASPAATGEEFFFN